MYEKLFNLAPVQFGAVSPGIGIVLAERPCEVVVTVERRTRTEEKIVMHLVVEHGVDGVDAGHADRRRRQPLVPVGIVGRLVFQVFVQDAPQPEVLHGILDRRIGLQGHPLAQAVDVHPCDTGHLVGLAGLLVDDRCEGHDLEPAQTAAFAQGIAPGRPETVVLALHALHELFGRHRPVELVGVGNEHRKERHAVEPHATRHFGRGQHLHDRRGVGVDLPGEFLRELRRNAGIVDRNPYRGLKPQFEHPRYPDHAHPGLQHIVAGLERLRQVDAPGIDTKSPMVPEPGQQGIGEALVVGTAADIEVAPRAHGIPVKLLPQDKTRRCWCYRGNESF